MADCVAHENQGQKGPEIHICSHCLSLSLSIFLDQITHFTALYYYEITKYAHVI